MQVTFISDIHGRSSIPADMATILSNAHLVVIAGDITNFGGYNDARRIIGTLATFNENILAIPGNCDRVAVNKFLIDEDISIHQSTKNMGNIALYGVGGSTTTPFHTPQEYPEQDLEKMLRGWERQQSAKWHVLVTHSPPKQTKIDRTGVGLHVGSKTIRMFIEKNKPDLVVCGHIHEARGVDKIQNTVIVNTGTFPKHCAAVTFNREFTVELC